MASLTPQLEAGYPRGLVHLLPYLLDRQLDAESDAVQDVLEVGLLVDLELYADGQHSVAGQGRAVPSVEVL